MGTCSRCGFPTVFFLLTLVVIYVLSEISLMPTSNGFVELSVP